MGLVFFFLNCLFYQPVVTECNSYGYPESFTISSFVLLSIPRFDRYSVGLNAACVIHDNVCFNRTTNRTILSHTAFNINKGKSIIRIENNDTTLNPVPIATSECQSHRICVMMKLITVN